MTGSGTGAGAAAAPGVLAGRATIARRRAAPPPATDEPVVSVVITCFNYGRFLATAARSVLGQRGVRPRLIIVDDASGDDSAAVARRLVAADPRVTLLRHQVNAGPVAAFNTGLAQATGEFVVRLDADDLLAPGALARAVAVLRAYPSVSLVYGSVEEFEGDPPAPAPPSNWTVRVYSGRAWLERRCRTGTNAITSPEVVVRRAAVERIGGMDPVLAHAHDMEWWLRAAATGDVAWIDGPRQAYHREHPASRYRNLMAGPFADAVERLLAFRQFFASEVSRAYADLEPVARRAVATQALELAARDYDRGRAPVVSEQACLELAVRADRRVQGSLSWRALALRRRLGRRITPVVPVFWLAMLRRRVRDDVSRARWRRTGV